MASRESFPIFTSSNFHCYLDYARDGFLWRVYPRNKTDTERILGPSERIEIFSLRWNFKNATMHSFSCLRKAKPFLAKIKVRGLVAEIRISHDACIYRTRKWTPISLTERNFKNYTIIIPRKWSVTLMTNWSYVRFKWMIIFFLYWQYFSS